MTKGSNNWRITRNSESSLQSDCPEPESSDDDHENPKSRSKSQYRRLSTAIESSTVWANARDDSSFDEKSF